MKLFDNQSIVEYKGKHRALHIVDGTNMFCRACFAGKSISESRKDLQMAVGIFLRLFKVVMKNQPTHVAIVFDSGRITFRHKLCPKYKADRTKSYIQNKATKMSVIKNMLEYSGFAVIDSKQYEADDIIGSLANRYSKKLSVRIFSEDKDFVQCITDNVTLYKNNTVYNKEVCFKKYGIMPDQFIDYLTLVGDSIDGIDGVSKWGPKSAAQYLTEYGTIENIVGKPMGKSLSTINTTDLGYIKMLTAIKKNIDVVSSTAALTVKKKDIDSVAKLIKKYGITLSGIYG